MIFSVNIFSGMAPMVSPRLLDAKLGQQVINALNTNGELTPLKSLLQIGNGLLAKPGVKKSIYRFGVDRPESEFWFHWTTDVNVVRGSINDDTTERTYFTGDGVPKFTFAAVATGSAQMPTVSYTLGIPKPDVSNVQFSVNNRAISSITRSGNLATVSTVAAHELVNNTDVVIAGADTLPVTIPITSITRSGTTATATTDGNHTLATGATVTVAGASDALYNVTAAITVTASNKFTYTLASAPAADATGTLSLTATLDAYNGKKTITVVNANTFTFPLTFVPTSDATGTITYNLGGLDESRVYAVSYVGSGGEEGAPSVISGIVTVTPGKAVSITGLPVAPAGAFNITKKRLYRSQDGTSGASLQFVADITLAATSFVDTVLGTKLGETIPTLDYEMPPEDMKGLIGFGNGMLAGISKNQVLISVPYQPHAWPVASRYSFANEPKALGAFGQSIVVLTNGMPSVLSGSSPDAMSQDLVSIGQPCLSARSAVEIANGVMWASDEGLAFISNSGFQLATQQIFTAKEWKTYAPTSIRAYRWENRYVGFYDTGSKQAGFLFDTQTGEFYELDFYATAGYTDPRNGNLYLAIGNDVYRFNGGASNLTATFKSKQFTSPKPINLGIAKVVAGGYPATFRLYASGALKYTKTVTSSAPFALPAGYKADEFEIEIQSQHAIKGFTAAETVRELAETIE